MSDSDPTSPDIGLRDDWDETVADRTVKERVYEVTTKLTEPTAVSVIADRADCTKEGARSHLAWFVEMGILRKTADNPALFERNEAYFEFRRITELVRRHETVDEIDAALEDYRARDAELAEYYDESAPELVVLAGVDDRFEAAHDRLAEWRTVRRRIRELKEARIRLASSTDPASTSTAP